MHLEGGRYSLPAFFGARRHYDGERFRPGRQGRTTVFSNADKEHLCDCCWDASRLIPAFACLCPELDSATLSSSLFSALHLAEQLSGAFCLLMLSGPLQFAAVNGDVRAGLVELRSTQHIGVGGT